MRMTTSCVTSTSGSSTSSSRRPMIRGEQRVLEGMNIPREHFLELSSSRASRDIDRFIGLRISRVDPIHRHLENVDQRMITSSLPLSVPLEPPNYSPCSESRLPILGEGHSRERERESWMRTPLSPCLRPLGIAVFRGARKTVRKTSKQRPSGH